MEKHGILHIFERRLRCLSLPPHQNYKIREKGLPNTFFLPRTNCKLIPGEWRRKTPILSETFLEFPSNWKPARIGHLSINNSIQFCHGWEIKGEQKKKRRKAVSERFSLAFKAKIKVWVGLKSRGMMPNYAFFGVQVTTREQEKE